MNTAVNVNVCMNPKPSASTPGKIPAKLRYLGTDREPVE
jgi:hypothetical protein